MRAGFLFLFFIKTINLLSKKLRKILFKIAPNFQLVLIAS